MNRKEDYADLDKWAATCARQKERYYGKSSYAPNHKQRWNELQDNLVMAHDIPDRQIAKRLQRSVKAVEIRRIRLIKRGVKNVIDQ